ncbi:MAG: alkane 1-monooxygenase [Gammaproteobacteria bacterium]
MTTTTFQRETSLFIDKRRVAWLLSTALMLLPLVGIGLREGGGSDIWLFVPTLILYGLVPLLDLVIGEDTSNPAETDVPQLEADRYYRWIVYLSLPLLWGTLVFCGWYAVNTDLTWYGYLGLAMAAGWTAGAGINAGHELGHKKSATERWLAKLALAPAAYGHFNIEHNRGHHRDVATPEDPVSSRLGESYYRFIQREIPGAAKRAWQLEATRLDRKGVGRWSLENDILQAGVITCLLWGGMIAWLGVGVIPLLLIQAGVGYSLLSSANYVEHYGLLRQRLESGRYERPEPRHSWNSNHILSNILLYQLQRHSDHHAHPTRRYQSLRHFEEAPQLPAGYFGMFLIAFVPPLWYRIMDPKVLAHSDNDIDRINMDPSRREALKLRYSL